MDSTGATLTVVTVAELAGPIRVALLRPRDITLKREAPKSTYAHQVRRSVACQNATPIEMLLAISIPDADDPRVAMGEIEEGYLAIIELLRARRRQRLGKRTQRLGRDDILRAIRKEDRREHAENDASHVVISDPDNIEALEAYLRASARERSEQEAVEQLVREHLAEVRLRSLGRGAAA